jgi:hypothetical protein
MLVKETQASSPVRGARHTKMNEGSLSVKVANAEIREKLAVGASVSEA